MKTIFIFCLLIISDISFADNGYWHNQKRTLCYHPDGNDFVIVNGKNKFNRALYSRLHTGFRIETSDVPEFGFYLPNMGGNLHFGLWKGNDAKWLNDVQFIEARYRAGSRIYHIRDSLLGKGELTIIVLPLPDKDGMILKAEFNGTPKNIRLLTVFGGASNRRFLRDGDLGVDPPDAFDLKAANCMDNHFSIQLNSFQLQLPPTKKGNKTSLYGLFPTTTRLRIGAFMPEANPISLWRNQIILKDSILLSKIAIQNNTSYYFLIQKNEEQPVLYNYKALKQLFTAAEKARQQLASRICISTPDSFINTLGGTLAVAADAIWGKTAYLHGAVGWRMPLPGWRGPYAGDVLGWHNRARIHFNSYAASQVVNVPVSLPSPALDTVMHLSRGIEKWGTPIYSNGYICRNPNNNHEMSHYDMNLCYTDELLWHFNWTGDSAYVKKMWPVLKLSLVWEKRNFDPENKGLYDAYAAIWASDGLQYNGGDVTHSTAYNYRANRLASEIAQKMGEDPAPYQQEADKIANALSSQLWMNRKGWWAEYKDIMRHKLLHPDAAAWTIYHAIDSKAGSAFQFYQAIRYLDTQIPHIPVRAVGLKDEGWTTIATSNWMPYEWSVNNVAQEEVIHTSLAYWESGRNNAAFKLFKSAILDGMYLGASPGNFGQISFYDAARGESYRDFADDIGIASRAIVQGLFGILPDALNNKLTIRPGYPDSWHFASLVTPDVSIDFKRNQQNDQYIIKQHFPKVLDVTLHLHAYSDSILSAKVNGRLATWEVDSTSVGAPCVNLFCGNDSLLNVQITWKNTNLDKIHYPERVAQGDTLHIYSQQQIRKIYDPQGVLSQLHFNAHILFGKITGDIGFRTFFVQLSQGQMTWWQPVNIEVKHPFEVVPLKSDDEHLKFLIKNNQNIFVKGNLTINSDPDFLYHFALEPNASSAVITVPDSIAQCGTNKLLISAGKGITYSIPLINWNMKNKSYAIYQMINMDTLMNDKVTQIFRNRYLSPRSPFTTLQLPWQGMGEWCHPLDSADIDDSGFRKAAIHNIFATPLGFSFRTSSDSSHKNITFTSLWNNYPHQIIIPLKGTASHAYLLMAGSTNYMQNHFVNGVVKILYTDGTCDSLQLINPESWCPIEQDYYTDGYAFQLKSPRPFRVYFKSGAVSRQLLKKAVKQPSYDVNTSKKKNGGDYIESPVSNVSDRRIDGGAGVILDVPLNKSKILKELKVETLANDVVIGLMGITLMR